MLPLFFRIPGKGDQTTPLFFFLFRYGPPPLSFPGMITILHLNFGGGDVNLGGGALTLSFSPSFLVFTPFFLSFPFRARKEEKGYLLSEKVAQFFFLPPPIVTAFPFPFLFLQGGYKTLHK